MPTPLSTDALDAVLALQLTIAWAGEARSTPPRLGWWQTDLVDELGGGDLLARLLPRTHAWAALEATREAARRVDLAARQGMASPDRLRTPFFFGFEIDEALGERLSFHKRGELRPEEALRLPLSLSEWRGAEALSAALRIDSEPGFKVVPGGRQLKGSPPSQTEAMAACLFASLAPFAPQYPLPFYQVGE